jgi:hypothetical protein
MKFLGWRCWECCKQRPGFVPTLHNQEFAAFLLDRCGTELESKVQEHIVLRGWALVSALVCIEALKAILTPVKDSNSAAIAGRDSIRCSIVHIEPKPKIIAGSCFLVEADSDYYWDGFTMVAGRYIAADKLQFNILRITTCGCKVVASLVVFCDLNPVNRIQRSEHHEELGEHLSWDEAVSFTDRLLK